jgi:hypothetical protein
MAFNVIINRKGRAMKSKLFAVFMLLFSIGAPAQPVTNWITTAPEFREVGGQVYNVNRSQLFHLLSGTCTATRPGVASVEIASDFQISGNAATTPSQEIVVLHCAGATVGQTLTFNAIQVGVTNLPRGDYQLWDCGTPHRVAVVTTNVATH